jgi:hypothetical protein
VVLGDRLGINVLRQAVQVVFDVLPVTRHGETPRRG